VGRTGLSYETRTVFFNYVRPSGFFFGYERDILTDEGVSPVFLTYHGFLTITTSSNLIVEIVEITILDRSFKGRK
jgi:hypothetical protein